MADDALRHIKSLQQQIESRFRALAQFVAQLETSSSGKPPKLKKKAKGTLIRVSKKTGKSRCHDLDTGEKFGC